jgi:hypothetical protein
MPFISGGGAITRRGKQIMVATVIIVHVGHQDILDPGRINPDGLQPVARGMQKIPSALARHGLVKARIDHEIPAAAGNRPDEIIHRHGTVIVRIPAQKILVREPPVMPIPQRVHFPQPCAHILRLSYYVSGLRDCCASPGPVRTGDNEGVIVPKAYSEQSQFAAAVAALEDQLHPNVVRIRHTLGNDWSGEPAVFFRIILSDSASARDQLLNVTNRVSAAIVQQIEQLEQWDVLPYFNFLCKSQQAQLN